MRSHRRWLVTALGLFVFLRIPSLFEPRWYPDESTYAYVGRTLFQGGLLYRSPGAWDNKPPLQYWMYGLVTHMLGYSEAALHSVNFLAGIVTLLAVYWGVRLYTRKSLPLIFALFATSILCGLPIFDGNVLLPETILIAPLTWSCFLAIASTNQGISHLRQVVYAAGAGILMSIALGFQQTVLADIFAVTVIFCFLQCIPWRSLLAFWIAGLAVTAMWLLPTLLASGTGSTFYALVLFYLAYAHNSLPISPVHIFFHFTLLVAAFLLITVGTWLAPRKSQSRVWMLWIIAGSDFLVQGAANYGYSHLLLPCIPIAAVAIATTSWTHWHFLFKRGSRSLIPLACGILIAAQFASITRSDWITARSLMTYYSGYASLVDKQKLVSWQDTFGSNIVTDAVVTEWLAQHHYKGMSCVLWHTSDEWEYLTAQLHTTLPTVGLYNDDILLNGTRNIGSFVADHKPTIIVTDIASLNRRPSIFPILAQYYRQAFSYHGQVVYIKIG